MSAQTYIPQTSSRNIFSSVLSLGTTHNSCLILALVASLQSGTMYASSLHGYWFLDSVTLPSENTMNTFAICKSKQDLLLLKALFYVAIQIYVFCKRPPS